MTKKIWDMQSLSDLLIQSIREYGIRKVSVGQYKTVCNKIIRFAFEKGCDSYYHELKTDYDAFIESKAKEHSICYEYARFQHRVIRMMDSLAETGKVDFSCLAHGSKRYVVSNKSMCLIEEVLDYHSLKGESKTEMSTVMRHFFRYAEDRENPVM